MSLILAALFSLHAYAADGSLSQKAEAPKPSKWSLGYNYAYYSFEGTSTANTGIYKFGDASVAMHLFTLSYQPSPLWTVYAFAPYLRNEVETIYEPTSKGMNLKTKDTSEGLSDVKLMALHPFWIRGGSVSLVDIGLSMPTGKVDSHFNSSPTQGASYNMQLGTGTPDLTTGLTYVYTAGKFSHTARGQYTARFGRNREDWALGNEWRASLASKVQALKYLNAGLQANYFNRDRVRGRSQSYERFNNYASPFDPEVKGDGHQYYHGSQATADLSAVLKTEYKTSTSQTLGLELSIPVLQESFNKDDIQLDTRYAFNGSVSASF
ncbi:MAG: hypothetical protein AB7F86_17960 [Bdellovibrionales bacterium]